jgi:hypothetical protein
MQLLLRYNIHNTTGTRGDGNYRRQQQHDTRFSVLSRTSLLGFLQALLIENLGGILEPATRGIFPVLGWVSLE